MFRIYDGRTFFYQWDTNRKLIVDDKTITEVHFCNRTDECSLICEVYNDGSLRLVDVPNILLQDNWRINVYAFDGSYTKHAARFEVKSRTKPSDYVYTETEIKNYDELAKRITQIENNGISDEKIGEAVERYLDDNDISVEVDLTDYATREFVNAEIEKIELTPGPVGPQGEAGKDGAQGPKGDKGDTGEAGKDGKDGISVSHSWSGTTLTIASASGTSSMDLKGAKGETGPKGDKGDTGAQGPKGDTGSQGPAGKDGATGSTGPKGDKGDTGPKGDTGAAGKDGYTPVKGVDYFTEADKQEIIANIGASGSSIPDYVKTEAERVARIVNKHQSNNSIVFPFLSDAHCGYYTDKTNAATTLAGQLLNLVGQRVPFDFIANGGDMANGAYDTTKEMSYEQIEDYTELTREATKGVPTVWAAGNHDDAPYQATENRLTQKEMFGLIGRKNRLSGAVCPNGCNYGYLDLENRKLRVICLDTDDKRSWGTVAVGAGESGPAYLNAHNIGGNQLDWLANTALDFSAKAKPAEWNIIIISHTALDASGTITDAVSGATYNYNTANAATILKEYMVGNSGSIKHNDATVNYDYSALANRASVICSVHGHNHKFTSETVSGILSIGCPNVMNGRERVSDDGNTYAKTAGTANGTSFCIITVDLENSLIYADCVGAGYNREFEYTTEVVSYTNLLPKSTDATGAIYNGKGWKENTYLSSGNDGAKSGTYASGFIPIEWNQYGNAVFYCKNVGMKSGQDGHRLCTYKADKSNLTTVKTTITNGWWNWGADGNIASITVVGNAHSEAAYIRLCCSYLGEDSIITCNEVIE